MVFVVGVGAALFLGLGWVLQQRSAAHAALSDLLSFRLLFHLMHKPVWWCGIGSMAIGAALGGVALLYGSVTLVEPLLSTNLLFAFVFAALAARRAVRPAEIVGALLLSAALGVFIGVGDPREAATVPPPLDETLVAAAAIAVVVLALITLARSRRLSGKSALIAAAAGVLFGMQDASTSALLANFRDHGVAALAVHPWPYLLFACGVAGITLSQSAFRAARLDVSLPPLVATEPIVGIAIGVSLLGNQLMVGPAELAAESICLIAMVAGIILIARSASLAHPFSHLHDVRHSVGR